MKTTLLAVLSLAVAAAQAQTKINWQGYTWNVRSANNEGPGPNKWDPSNVWIDDKGDLHMKTSYKDGQWSCAEIWTDQDLGFGTYQCQVEGPLDKLDPNVIFSMFSYKGPDGVMEIDIEYAKWGNPKDKNAWWTVYPNDREKGKKSNKGFNFSLDGTDSTSRYTWTDRGVLYSFLGGYADPGSGKGLIEQWEDNPAPAAHSVPQKPMPLHFNLWLFEGKPPTDGKPVEFVVHSFSFKKYEGVVGASHKALGPRATSSAQS